MAIPNSVCFAPWLRCNPLARSHSRQAAVHHRISWTFILSIGEGPRDISAFAENICCRQSRVVVPLDDGDRKLYLLHTLYGSTTSCCEVCCFHEDNNDPCPEGLLLLAGFRGRGHQHACTSDQVSASRASPTTRKTRTKLVKRQWVLAVGRDATAAQRASGFASNRAFALLSNLLG